MTDASTAQPGSLIDRLRHEREQAISRDRHLDLPIPGYKGLLSARYGPLPWEDLYSLTRAGGSAEEVLAANMDALIRACKALMVRDDDGELASLADTARGQGADIPAGVEIRFDTLAVEALGLDVEKDTARAALAALFAGATSPELAITTHGGALGSWLRGVGQEVDADLVGEQ